MSQQRECIKIATLELADSPRDYNRKVWPKMFQYFPSFSDGRLCGL